VRQFYSFCDVIEVLNAVILLHDGFRDGEYASNAATARSRFLNFRKT